MRAIDQGMLSCSEVAVLLQPWVDGEFDATEGALIDGHLVACASCARIARLQSQFKLALRRSAGRSVAAPLTLREAILARLDEADDEAQDGDAGLDEDPAKALWSRAFQRLTPRAVAFTAAIAGIGAWLIAGGLQHPLLQADADRGRYAAGAHTALEDGVSIHAHTLPLDYAASDAGSVQRWLQGKLDFGVRLPRFQRNAPSLQGVRLSTMNARTAAVVSYTVPADQGRRVSLVITDDPGQELKGVARQVAGRQVWMSRARGYNVASWRSDEIVYSLISDLDERDVLQLVQAAELR